MAHAIQLTIGASNKVSINYQSQDVSVSLTYELEREDTDVLAIARDKAGEVAAVHRIAWEQLRDAKVAVKKRQEVVEQQEIPASLTSERGSALTELSVDSSPSQSLVESKAVIESEVYAEDKAVVKANTCPGEAETGDSIVLLSAGQAAAIQALAAQAGWTKEQMQMSLLDQFGIREVNALSTAQAAQILVDLQREERLKVQVRSQSRRTNPTSSRTSSTNQPPSSSNGYHTLGDHK